MVGGEGIARPVRPFHPADLDAMAELEALMEAEPGLRRPLSERELDGALEQYYVCPICFSAKELSQESLIGGAELQGTVPSRAWIGDGAAATFSY